MNTNRLNESLVVSLAKHTALGDLLGQGDRHFENYVISDDVLYQ